MALIFFVFFFFWSQSIYSFSSADSELKLHEIYLKKKSDFSQKEQRAYDLLFDYRERIDEANCSDARVIGQTGKYDHLSDTRQHGEFDFNLWKQDNFETYSECYEMGEIFGAGKFTDVEERLATKIMTEEELKDWLHTREVQDLENEVERLKAQKARALRSSRAAYYYGL
jgi:hypothetical protein